MSIIVTEPEFETMKRFTFSIEGESSIVTIGLLWIFYVGQSITNETK